VPEPLIAEPVAAEVDYSVARLNDLNPEAGAVVIDHFLLGWSLSRIGREVKLKRHQVRQRLDAGVAWIAGRLDREEY
jgi:DNA-directed RNA polymerase specialized sigma24 family protein